MVHLHIPLGLWQRIQSYARAASPNEVTGIGLMKMADREFLSVTRLFLPKQSTCAGFCDFAEGELNQIILEVIQEDPKQAKMLCFRWHSHAEGSVFWSGRDEQDIDAWKGAWVANLVVNVRGDYCARLDIFEPLRLKNIPVEVAIDCPLDPEIDKVCAQEVHEKLTEIPPTWQLTGQMTGVKKGDGYGLFGSKQHL